MSRFLAPFAPFASLALVTSATLIALTAAPAPAAACGGTFCDVGPQAMPVDQTGETILFAMEDGWVEAHVQIDYQGDPEQFAWIVPIMAEPEVSVGSQPLIEEALAATVPTFVVDRRFEGDCGSGPGPACGVADFATVAVAGDGDFFEEEPQAPTVRTQDVVGAFEYAVLSGGTVEGIGQWLDDNEYARDDQAPEILQTYLDEGFLFVAFKLRPGAGVDQIHPVVLRYAGTEPCIPIRLTRIAAVEDMPIRALFLGDARVVPTNYRHVELNPLRFDWTGLGDNYDQVVREALDADGANGRAFVTEYAGPSTEVNTVRIRGLGWDTEDFELVSGQSLTDLLDNQGFFACDEPNNGECGLTHPLMLPLLQTYLPPPPELSPEDFYACSDCFEVDESTWDVEGFMAAFEEQVLAPGEHALQLLADHSYLTRLFTMLSPGEMTVDPLFHERRDLPTVSNRWTATRIDHCEDNSRLELDAGYTIYLNAFGNQPVLEASAALRVEEIPSQGAPVLLADAEAAASDELAAWNATHGPSSGCECRASRRRWQGWGWPGLLALLGLRARSRRPRSR